MKKNVFRGILAVVLVATVVVFTVSVGAVTAIDVISQNETPNYRKRAVAVIDRIIESNNTAVDGVTGATKSGNAIKAAVDNALKQATVYGDISFLTPDFLKNIIGIFVWELTFIKAVCS